MPGKIVHSKILSNHRLTDPWNLPPSPRFFPRRPGSPGLHSHSMGSPMPEGDRMDKDRVAGAAKNVKGTIKEAVGKALGDAKLQADGKADKVEGKVQNAVGGLKDTVRDQLKK